MKSVLEIGNSNISTILGYLMQFVVIGNRQENVARSDDLRKRGKIRTSIGCVNQLDKTISLLYRSCELLFLSN